MPGTQAGRVRSVPAVLAMNTDRHTSSPSRHTHFQGRQVAGMHDCRPQAAHQIEEFGIESNAMACRLMQLEQLDPWLPDAGMEGLIARGQGDDRVAVTLPWHMIDEINDAVFQTADAKT